ncbi:MAG: hypothetical protein M1837_004210 [Sclerophora amabilis]|nr:MAG: hypothetical protein M1837_004210 [Sclerophora amabilis]
MIEEKVQEKVERETVDPGRRDYIGVLDTPKIIMNNSSGDLENGNIDVDVVSESEDSEDWQSVISSHSILEERDVMSFRGEWNRLPGRLIIYSDGIRFVRSFPTKHEFWRRSFLELAEMRKRSGSSLSKALSLDQHLEIDFTDGVTARIGAMRDRDEAFNTIIGFSGLQWQNLQAGPNSDK